MGLTKVFITILNYNGHEHTIECLESIYKIDYSNIQILLVDNSPVNESVNEIINWCKGYRLLNETLFPDLVLPPVDKPVQYRYIEEVEFDAQLNYQEKLIIVKANQNKGFASGNNIALNYIQQLKDDCFIWLLNNDTVVEKSSLTYLVNHYYNTSNKKIGLIGSKLLYYNASDKLNGVGGVYNKWLAVADHLGESETDNFQYDSVDTSAQIEYVIGASMFLPKRFLKEVGLLNEAYFLFFEELDWAYRGKAKGWDIGYQHQSVVYHKESASISPEKAKSQLFETSFLASRIIFSLKYNKRALIYIYLTMIPMLINRIRRKQFSRVLPLIKVAIRPSSFKKSIVKQLNNK